MGKFKTYRIHEIEKKVVARFEELSLEDLDKGEVVIRVAYSSVNYKAALAATGAGSIAIDILSRLGYRAVALTGKENEAGYLKELGAKEVMSRRSLDLSKIKPLDKASWAGSVDNLGGEVLAWMASTMMPGGTIASIGLAASMNLNTSVAPFILRGVSLLGIDSGATPMPLRREVWRRLAGDMRPAHLEKMTRTIAFDDLPQAFDGLLKGAAKRRIVVDLAA